MKSNVCKIEKGTGDLSAILNESEKVAAYIGLDRKQSSQLRLLCEEIDGMLPNVIDDFEGSFWIEHDDGVCKIKASIEVAELNATKKKDLIAVAKNNKNAAAVGIIGKIRNLIENFFCKLKDFKRIAMRAEKTDESFAANIYLAATIIHLR